MDVAKKIGTIIEANLGAQNILTNGGFETGDFTDWEETHNSFIEETFVYSGNYSCLIHNTNDSAGYIIKNLENIPVKEVNLYSLSYAADNFTEKLKITITYFDDTTSEDNFIILYGAWGPVVYTIPSMKKVKNIKFESINGCPIYVDEVKVLTGMKVKYDEFDPKDPLWQVLLENFPIRSEWVIRGVYRTIHNIRITIYKKLIRYNPDVIESTRTEWYTFKGDIDAILTKYKFSVPEVINLELIGGWDDGNTIAVGRGIKTITEPIVWQSEQMVQCIYYTSEELVDE